MAALQVFGLFVVIGCVATLAAGISDGLRHVVRKCTEEEA